jgi:hypothetical protein
VPSTQSELLQSHRPVLRYDSNESYFADSAAEWTDHRGNRLKRGSEVLAAADPDGATPALSLAFLGTEYPDKVEAEKTDLIDCPDQNYVADAAEMHQQAAYRNKMYGRAVREPDGGSLWLQYWFFYFYNDFNLIGPLIKAGLHEGDWEMIQLRLGEDEVPDLAAYAQHTAADVRPWSEVDLVDGNRPVVYVARGSHASYFTAGTHWLGHGWDHANGKRKTPEVELLEIEGDAPGWEWVSWPGRWGGTVGGPVPLIDDASPTAPIMHGQWHNPADLLPKVDDKARLLAAAPSPPPLPVLSSVKAERTPAGFAVDYKVEPAVDEKLLGLAVTVNSVDEATVPPQTRTARASELSGIVHLDLPLDPNKRYDITVSAAFTPYLATKAIQVDLPPASAQAAPTTT